eukprot:g8394.t1 g8394   contig29:416916-417580(-)
MTCPELVTEDHLTMFLRCELFNVELAALRLANYWNRRIELFGDNLSFRPLHNNDDDDTNNTIDKADITKIETTLKGLSYGLLRPTTTHDSTGRALLFIDPSRLANYNKHNECHPPWFFGKVAFPLMKLDMPERMRKRVRVHVGSEEKVLKELEEVGIGREVLPSEIGGNVVLDNDGWMQERKMAGL